MEKVKKICMILLGNILYAFGVSYFIVPAGLISGGITGLSLFLNKAFSLPLSPCIWAVCFLFFLCGLIMLGKEYALSILLSTIAYPLFYSAFEMIYAQYGPLTDDIVLCTAFAGICFGLGIGLVMRTGASAGGSDVIAMILLKKRGFAVQTTLYLVDAVILCLQIPFSRPDQILYGLLFVLAYTLLLGKVMLFGQGKVQILIYSEAFEEINRLIVSEFHRGTTILYGEGGYRRENTKIIQTVIPQRSLFTIRERILKIEPQAFIVINSVSEVNGRGFTLKAS